MQKKKVRSRPASMYSKNESVFTVHCVYVRNNLVSGPSNFFQTVFVAFFLSRPGSQDGGNTMRFKKKKGTSTNWFSVAFCTWGKCNWLKNRGQPSGCHAQIFLHCLVCPSADHPSARMNRNILIKTNLYQVIERIGLKLF